MRLPFSRQNQPGAIKEESDERLVQKASRRGEEGRAAFQALIDRYGASVRVYLRGRLQNPSDAEDIYQQVWLSAWEHIAQCRIQFRSWVLSIAINKVRDVYRVAQARPSGPPLDTQEAETLTDTTDVAGQALSTLADEQTIALIGKLLADEYKGQGLEIALKRWVEGHSAAEIAAALNLSPNTVNQRLFQMKKRLQETPALRKVLFGEENSHDAK